MRYAKILFIAVLFSGCIEDDFFGLSPYGNIKALEVSNQASKELIDQVNKVVYVEIPGGVALDELKIKTLTLSSFSSADVGVGDFLDLSEEATITVSAEDGSVHVWTIVADVASATPQLPNSDFQAWYQTASGYYEPGEDATTTVWGTGNPGTDLLGLYATTPEENESDNLVVRMETLYNGRLAETFGTPISAGTIYTGTFDNSAIDPNDPEAAIEFGTPFSGRPQAFSVSYSWEPGAENKDRRGNVLDFPDMCDIYCLLEVRSGGSIKRLATGWFRGESAQAEMTELTIDFTYGPLDSSFPDYAFPEEGGFVSIDSADFILPTHITFVASSSFDGANFAGAVGSLLKIDDLELIYE